MITVLKMLAGIFSKENVVAGVITIGEELAEQVLAQIAEAVRNHDTKVSNPNASTVMAIDTAIEVLTAAKKSLSPSPAIDPKPFASESSGPIGNVTQVMNQTTLESMNNPNGTAIPLEGLSNGGMFIPKE
jgi:hypothetical protein